MDGIMNGQPGAEERQCIAYFSMEIGLQSHIPTYAGGLGVLAGDSLRSAADLRIPVVGVTLVSKKGHFRQRVDDQGNQFEEWPLWEPSTIAKLVPERVNVTISGEPVQVGAWLYSLDSPRGGSIPVLLLDTDLQGNSSHAREITHYLYGGDDEYRLQQEMILGMGGVRFLKVLGFRPKKYHMNEGHSSFLALELLKNQGMDLKEAKGMCIFTTHTPVDAGYDKFPYPLVERLMGPEDAKLLKSLIGGEVLNMTLLALELSKYVNGVTKSHGLLSERIFPGYRINSITNGVHSHTWTSLHFRRLYDKYLPGWANEPELLTRMGIIPDEEIWQAHHQAKRDLLEHVKRSTGQVLDEKVLTIGFARRFTEYKRPTFIFSDLERLRKVIGRGPLQVIMAGKAHPRDEGGKHLIREVFRYRDLLKDEIPVVYLQNYDMETASSMVAGVDLWLNTPLRPLEASGTSGMKAAHNGVVNMSVLDGWWIEGCVEGVTGWSIGPAPAVQLSTEDELKRELDDLYGKLEYVILPTFYHREDDWMKMMNSSIEILASYFNSHRMMRRYVTEAYL